jgi:hypothetical protein
MFSAEPLRLLLPLIFFLLLLVWVRRWQSKPSLAEGGWEGGFLLAGALMGAFHALTTETLSLAGALRPNDVRPVWLVADIALAIPLVALILRGWRPRLRWHRPRLKAAEWVFLALVTCLLVGLLVVAWSVPPNTPDSLLYHMARVAHWAQGESLTHYGTAYGHQLWNPPFAETVILALRLLSGGDRAANLVQWAAFGGVLIGVSGLTRLLGLGRPARLLAIAFAASLPMAVLQATSTQNDLVTAFWLVTASFFVLLSRKVNLGGRTRRFGRALGLRLLTKGVL